MRNNDAFEVYDRRCESCLLGPKPLAADPRATLEACLDHGTFFLCHFAPDGTIIDRSKPEIACAAFHNAFPYHSAAQRLAAMMGIVREIPQPRPEGAKA